MQTLYICQKTTQYCTHKAWAHWNTGWNFSFIYVQWPNSPNNMPQKLKHHGSTYKYACWIHGLKTINSRPTFIHQLFKPQIQNVILNRHIIWIPINSPLSHSVHLLPHTLLTCETWAHTHTFPVPMSSQLLFWYGDIKEIFITFHSQDVNLPSMSGTSSSIQTNPVYADASVTKVRLLLLSIQNGFSELWVTYHTCTHMQTERMSDGD